MEHCTHNSPNNKIPAGKEGGVPARCGGKCGHCPTVIIHGIGQSELYVLDENGKRKIDKNGREIMAWPLSADMKSIARGLARPMLKMLITRKDNGFSDKAAAAVKSIFAPNASAPDGRRTGRTELVRYPNSVACCSEKEKNFIYSCIRLTHYTQTAGEDHLYYFAYDSFGNNLSVAEELFHFIQKVKEETGHSKINLVPVSLGGTIANSLFEFYPQVSGDLNRVVYIVPALDGSNIVGDIYTGNLSLKGKMLYNDLFPSFMRGYKGYLVNLLLRIPPRKVLSAAIEKTLAALQETVFSNSTVMWGLVPCAYYSEAAARHISDPAHAEIKRQADLYHMAQLHSKKNIMSLVEHGVSVFDIVDYNKPLYAIAGSWGQCNADGVIHLGSTSMGAASGLVDTPLPNGYTQQNTFCKNPSHNHISPDGIVDASAGLLPDHTFYFYNQQHEGTGRNDVIIKLATELLLNDGFKDIDTMPERFPQFNTGRETRNLSNDIANAKKIDWNSLAPADAAELKAAIEQTETMLENTVVVFEEFTAARERLYAILAKIGLRSPPRKSHFDKFALSFLKFASGSLFKLFGPQ